MTKSNDSEPQDLLRVGGGTDCHKLAARIAGSIERGNIPTIEYIGAGAGNQAVKGVSIANSMLARQGLFISVTPVFQKREFSDNPRAVAMQLRVLVHTLIGDTNASGNHTRSGKGSKHD